MFLVASLVPFVVLVNIVVANPTVVHDSPISLRISRQTRAFGTTELIKRDQRRARNFVGEDCTFRAEGTLDVGITNNNTLYVAKVGVGSPATSYNLVVDTGSANTFVGVIKPYVKTNSSVKTNNSVSVPYGSATFSGIEYKDTVTIAPGLIVPNQSIGVALTSTNLSELGVDGIIGLGPTNLTSGTLRPDKNRTIPTVMDNLFKNGAIPSNMLSLYFEPTNGTSAKNGELTFGGVDDAKFTGNLTYVNITTTFPSNQYWGLNQSIRYGDSVPILDNSAGILDSGTTSILLATEAYDRYVNATGAILDSNNTGLLYIAQEQFSNLKPLLFTIGERTFEFPPDAQIWPRGLSGGQPGRVYLVVSNLPNATDGLQFISGHHFLERFYSVCDTGNKRIGLAETRFTMSNINY